MENLENADKKLDLLLEPKLKVALEDYVHKQDAQVDFLVVGGVGFGVGVGVGLVVVVVDTP